MRDTHDRGRRASYAPRDPQVTWPQVAWLQVAWPLAAGIAAAVLSWYWITTVTAPTDFEFWWRGARTALAGADPYAARPQTPAWPLPDRLFYPGPALVLAAPFARLPLRVAFTLWGGLGAAVLAWALTRRGRAVAPVLLSAPFLVALRFGQWSPWLAAAVLAPTLGALLTAKPTLGAALFGARPSGRAVAGGVAVTLASLAWLPAWPLAWLANLHHVVGHPPPVATPFGAAVLLAALRWRQPEARFLLLYACVPQLLLFADQLPLLLVARRRVEAIALWGASWVAFAYWFLPLPAWDAATPPTAAPYVLAGVYLPALGLVLSRPNEGPAPAWLERLLTRARVPGWLRGRGGPAPAVTAAAPRGTPSVAARGS